MSLYKRWNYTLLLNNLIMNSYSTLQKTLIFLKIDLYKFFFFNYNKKTTVINLRALTIKNKLSTK